MNSVVPDHRICKSSQCQLISQCYRILQICGLWMFNLIWSYLYTVNIWHSTQQVRLKSRTAFNFMYDWHQEDLVHVRSACTSVQSCRSVLHDTHFNIECMIRNCWCKNPRAQKRILVLARKCCIDHPNTRH